MQKKRGERDRERERALSARKLIKVESFFSYFQKKKFMMRNAITVLDYIDETRNKTETLRREQNCMFRGYHKEETFLKRLNSVFFHFRKYLLFAAGNAAGRCCMMLIDGEIKVKFNCL